MLLNNNNTLKSTDNATLIKLGVVDENQEFIDLTVYKRISVTIGKNETLYSTIVPQIVDKTTLQFANDGNIPHGKYSIQVNLVNSNDTVHVVPNVGYLPLTIEKSFNEIGEIITTISFEDLLTNVDKIVEEIKKPSILQNKLNRGRLLTSFNKFVMWYGTAVQDTNYSLVGKTSLKISTDSSNTTSAARLRSVSYDLSKAKRLLIRLYIEDINMFSNFELRLSSLDDMSTYLSYKTTKWKLIQGWNEIMIPLSKLTVTGAESLANKITTIQASMTGEIGTSIWLDAMYVDTKGTGNVLFHFDDGFATQYTKAFNILNYRGMVGSCGLISDYVGTGSYMTLDQAKEMYSYGWDMFNHTKTHADLSLLTKEEIQIEIDGCRDYLLKNGLTRAADLVAYPKGLYNDAVMEVMQNYRMGRIVREEYEVSPSIQKYKLKVINLTNAVTVDAAKAHIDNAVETGLTLIFLLHRIEDTGTDDMIYLTSNLQAIVDYVYSKKDSLNVLTWSEYADMQ